MNPIHENILKQLHESYPGLNFTITDQDRLIINGDFMLASILCSSRVSIEDIFKEIRIQYLSKLPHEELLCLSGAIDLRDNYTIEDLGNGRVQIHPIDPNKKYKRND